MLPKYKAKKYLLNALDNLPPRIGYKGYYFFQHRFNKISIDQRINEFFNSYQSVLKLSKDLDIPIFGKSILEIGSGWLPVIPYFFKFLSGAREVNTFDVNCHYDAEKIKILNRKFLKKFDVEISEEGGKPLGLPSGINYFSNTNLCGTKFPSVDIVFSRYVLEHVTPADIQEMHRKFKNELPKGTPIIHMISPSDHRAYINKELSLQDFLRYSPEEWDRKQTKFDYHNRLRLPQYVELFDSLGFEITFLEFDAPKNGSEAYITFKEVPIHEDFQQFSDEELMAGAIIIVLKT